MTFTLLPFQTRASDQISLRFELLIADNRRPMEYAGWPTPFYQALSALPGSGKTPILADAVSQLRALQSLEPIVLWISKAKSVVEQTLSNFEPGGKYEALIEGFVVVSLSELSDTLIADATCPVIAIATVGSFNQKDKADGSLKVHQVSEDQGKDALWTTLTNRKSATSDRRRPLIIVYDEGHNLSDQQTSLLLELEPDAILVASATMRTPGRLGQIIDRLRQSGWSDRKLRDDVLPSNGLVTAVSSRDVVEAGLVKRKVVLAGYATEMETALSELLSEFKSVSEKAKALDAGFAPKAVYVSRTNVAQDDGTTDNANKPFNARKAPPILIWRYLVEEGGVDPATIAVYCDLKVNRKDYPLPKDFNLFSGGEDDFSAFTAGDFTHIIFNQSLQEGWDDPSCCFAYIDKSMGSAIQVEQVIGRLLRQPNARHYPDPDLNTAYFYLRIDERQEFDRTLRAVQAKLAAEMPEVHLEGFSDGRDRNRTRLKPKTTLRVPQIHIDADGTVDPLQQVISNIHDYSTDTTNTLGAGQLTRATQAIGDGSIPIIEVKPREHSNRVVARWLVRRAMQSLYPEAVKTVDWTDQRFEARVEITSRAAKSLKEDAEKLVDAYLQNAELAFETANQYTVSDVIVKPDEMNRFKHSGHDGYSDLSSFELEFAQAIDETGLSWVRNPTNGGFSIPLLEKGDTRNFFPDFLVWKADLIYALDPKGEHLIAKDAGRKLLSIRDEKGKQRVLVRLLTSGKWSHETLKMVTSGGYSCWKLTSAGQLRCTHHSTVNEAVRKALDL